MKALIPNNVALYLSAILKGVSPYTFRKYSVGKNYVERHLDMCKKSDSARPEF